MFIHLLGSAVLKEVAFDMQGSFAGVIFEDMEHNTFKVNQAEAISQ